MSQAATSKLRAAFLTKLCANCAKRDTTFASTSAGTAVIRPSKSKCTTASAFTSARANHAKTARRRDTSYRYRSKRKSFFGEIECGEELLTSRSRHGTWNFGCQ